MNKILKHKVIKASFWYTFSNFFSKGIMFLTIPIFTRLLSTIDYGKVSLFNSWVSIFIIILSLNVTSSLGKAKFEFKNKYNEYSSSILFLSLLIFIILFSILFIFKNFLSVLLDMKENVVIFLLISSFSKFIMNFYINKKRFEYKYKIVSLLTIIITITGVVLSIYLIKYHFASDKYLGQILGTNILIILFAIFSCIIIFIKGKTFFNFNYWKFALSFSLPLVLHNLSQIINGNFDRILINKFIGDSATGIYSFAYSVGMIIVVLHQSSSQAWIPWFFEKLENNEKTVILKRSKNYRDVFLYLYMVALLLIPEIIRLMSDSAYWEGIKVIPWVFLAYFFQFLYSFEANVEMYYKKTSMISIGTIISAITNIILNIIFIPIYGYIAAAITTTVSYLVLFFIHYVITNKILHIGIYNFYFYLPVLIISIIFTIGFYLIIDYFFIRLLVLIIITLIYIRTLKKLFKNEESRYD